VSPMCILYVRYVLMWARCLSTSLGLVAYKWHLSARVCKVLMWVRCITKCTRWLGLGVCGLGVKGFGGSG
jgi:hypothetical protein